MLVLGSKSVIVLMVIVWSIRMVFVDEDRVEGLEVIVEFGWLFVFGVVFYEIVLDLVVFFDLEVSIIFVIIFVDDDVGMSLVIVLLSNSGILGIFDGGFDDFLKVFVLVIVVFSLGLVYCKVDVEWFLRFFSDEILCFIGCVDVVVVCDRVRFELFWVDKNVEFIVVYGVIYFVGVFFKFLLFYLEIL